KARSDQSSIAQLGLDAVKGQIVGIVKIMRLDVADSDAARRSNNGGILEICRIGVELAVAANTQVPVWIADGRHRLDYFFIREASRTSKRENSSGKEQTNDRENFALSHRWFGRKQAVGQASASTRKPMPIAASLLGNLPTHRTAPRGLARESGK